MKAFRAVLFDLDGVVIDTRQSVTDFWQAVAAEQNVTLTAADFDQYVHGIPVVATLRAWRRTEGRPACRVVVRRRGRSHAGW